MKVRSARWAGLVVACTGVVGLGANYTWTDNGVGHAWSTAANWYVPGQIGFPNSCAADATIPSDTPWTVQVQTYTINDLTISEDVEFRAGGGRAPRPTLTVDSLTINGPATLTMQNATIIAKNPCP